jgi:hypothetical protein
MAKHHSADVEVIERRRLRVVFNKAVSKKEAEAAVLAGDVNDYLDEEELEILEVKSVRWMED